MKVLRNTLFTAITLAPLAVLAEQPAMKPGLWEYSMKMEMPGMPFPLPPVKTQRCLTQAEIDRGDQYAGDEQDECQLKNLKQRAGSASYEVACKDGTTGHYEFTFSGDSMQGTGVTDTQGQKVTTHFASKRLGDCKS